MCSWKQLRAGAEEAGESDESKKVVPSSPLIYPRGAAVSEALGALRPEFLRPTAPRRSVEGYIRRSG